MKRVVAVILLLCMCFSLCACGKSEESAKADELILAIGEISTDKIAFILEAQEYYNGLTEKQKKQVENYNILVSAVEKLPELMKENDYNEAMNYFEQGDYANALTILSDLGDFKNAKMMAEKCELYLSPVFAFADYIVAEGSYLAAYQGTGVSKTYGDATIAVIDKGDSLSIVYEIGEPCFDWKDADFSAIINYMESMEWVYADLFAVGDDLYNHAKVDLTLYKETGEVTCNIEYIVYSEDFVTVNQVLAMALLKGNFKCSEYNFDADFEAQSQVLGGFGETDIRGNQLMAAALEDLSLILKDSGLGYSLRDIGWECVG